MKKIAVLPGDGVGPEVTAAAVSALDAVTGDLEMINADIGLDCFKRTGEYLPRETIDIIDEADAILFGTIMDPEHDKLYRNPLLTINKHLDLYINIRPAYRLAPDIGIEDVNMLVIRENTEGIVAVAESEDLDGMTVERRVSIKGCKRICRKARQIAEGRGRKKISCVHKADVLRLSDGLFLDTFYEEMEGTTVRIEDCLIDRVAADMILEPELYDTIVTLNLYGDIISEIASGLVGGSYLTPSGNLGDTKGLFLPMHEPHPELTGLNLVNPISSILSSSMMLEFLGMDDEAEKIKNAVMTAVRDGHRTEDLGGCLGTYEFTEKIAELCRRT